jgi:hypothetical protein
MIRRQSSGSRVLRDLVPSVAMRIDPYVPSV